MWASQVKNASSPNQVRLDLTWENVLILLTSLHLENRFIELTCELKNTLLAHLRNGNINNNIDTIEVATDISTNT